MSRAFKYNPHAVPFYPADHLVLECAEAFMRLNPEYLALVNDLENLEKKILAEMALL